MDNRKIKGELLYKERVEIFNKNILFGKFSFYLFIIIPIIFTIIMLYFRIFEPLIFIIIYGISIYILIFEASPLFFAKKLEIYENGFQPNYLPIKYLFKDYPFIKYKNIRNVVITKPKHNLEKIQLVSIKYKDNTLFTIEKKFVDEIILYKLVDVLREKIPNRIKEKIKSGI